MDRRVLIALSDQRTFLELSSQAFDAGHLIEARRLAVYCRVLLRTTKHGRKPSVSLFDQAGWMASARFPTPSREALPSNVGAFPPLHLVSRFSERGWETSIGGGRAGDLIPFEAWWTEPIALIGDPISRQDVVHWLADQDGGAHLDPVPDSTYVRWTDDGQVFGRSTGHMSDNAFLYIMRAVAAEVMSVMDEQFAAATDLPRGDAVEGPNRRLP